MTKRDGDHSFDSHSMERSICLDDTLKIECSAEKSSSDLDSISIAINNEDETVETCSKDINSATKEGNTSSKLSHHLLSQLNISKISSSSSLLKRAKLSGFIIFISLYLAFFLAALLTTSVSENDNYWCNSDGLLIIINTIVALGLIYFKIFKVYINKHIFKIVTPSCIKIRHLTDKRFAKFVVYGVISGVLLLTLVLDSVDDRSRLVSAFGILVLIGLGTLFSAFPKQIDYRQVFGGIIIQIFTGLLILRLPIGKSVFQCTGDKVSVFLNFTYAGSTFAFGNIITDMNSYVFSFLTMILFFGLFVSIFYYYGILQWIIIKLGWLLEVVMGTTPCESMAASANIFLGQSEAPLVIKPYLHLLTKSELHAVLTGGFATIAGTILAAYISFGIAPAHLISASVMSAPAALAMSKLFYPETENSETKSSNIKLLISEEKNVLHAIINGIRAAIPLIANITASTIAFIALISFANAVFDWGCQLLNYESGTCEVQGVLAYLLFPIAWIMGTPPEDCYKVGYLLGTKFFVTEFVAYRDLMYMSKNGLISSRSVVICTYALCGFSSLPSLGSLLGGMRSLAPTRAHDMTKISFRALIAGNFACYMTACIAGTLIQDSSSRPLPFNSTGTL